MRPVFALLIALAAAPGAPARADAPAIDYELDLEAVTLITPLADTDASTDPSPLLGELSLVGQAETILDSGLRLRGRTALRAQYDAPSRPGGTGGFGADPFAATGAFSGLSSATPLDERDLRLRFESAYLQVDGGYGELRFGKDQGIAARFFEGAPSALSHARLDSPLLDPSGLAIIQTRHDLTGPSAKLSYASPRLLGLRAGISYTPKADSDGLDRRPAAGTGGVAPDIENALEIALNGSHKFRQSGLRLEAGLAWSTAEISPSGLSLPLYSRVETVSAGANLEHGDWSAGASWLQSNNGLTKGNYSAFSIGLGRRAWDTDFTLTYGAAEDEVAQIDSNSWNVAAARDVNDGARIGIAAFQDELETSLTPRTAKGIVVEITLSEEILKLSGN